VGFNAGKPTLWGSAPASADAPRLGELCSPRTPRTDLLLSILYPKRYNMSIVLSVTRYGKTASQVLTTPRNAPPEHCFSYLARVQPLTPDKEFEAVATASALSVCRGVAPRFISPCRTYLLPIRALPLTRQGTRPLHPDTRRREPREAKCSLCLLRSSVYRVPASRGKRLYFFRCASEISTGKSAPLTSVPHPQATDFW